jgi:hypothetical protein
MRGTAQQQNTFERTLFDPGTYPMTLKKALVMWGKPTQFQPDGAPKIMFVWEYEADGQTFELVDYLGFPKNFAFNDKSIFWKRVGEIAGTKITSENADTVDIDLGEFIQSYDELVDHLQSKDEKGNNEKAEVKGLTVGDQQLIGKTCQLVVKVWDSNGKQGNEIAAVLPMGGGAGPRKPQKQAAQPAPAPAAPQQTNRPPARPAQPAAAAQAEADLPF